MRGKFINFRSWSRFISLFLALNFFLSSAIVKAEPNQGDKKSGNDDIQAQSEIKSNQSERTPKPGENSLANKQNFGNGCIKSRWEKPLQEVGDSLTQARTLPQSENDDEVLYPADLDPEMKMCTVILSSREEFILEDSRLKHIVYGEKDGTGGGHTKKSIDYREKSKLFEVQDIQHEDGYKYKVKLKDSLARLETKSVFPEDWEVRDIISAIGFCLENYVNLKTEGKGVKEYISCYCGVCICVVCNGNSIVTAFPLNPSSYYFISNSNEDASFYDVLKSDVTFFGDKWIRSPIKKSLLGSSFLRGVTPKQRCQDKFWSPKETVAIRNFFHAAMHNHVDILGYLLSKGININALDDNERTPLIVAIERDNLEAVQALVNGGADLNISNYEVGTPLHVSLKNHYERITLFLLTKKDVNVNALNLYGRAPLHVAVESSSPRVVKALLNNGATADIGDAFLNPPMFFVIDVKILNVLLEKHIDINVVNRDKENYLHFVMRKTTRKAANRLAGILSKLNFDINAKDIWGMTVLHIAACKNDLDSIKFLLSKKVLDSFHTDVNIKDLKGLTPLDIAEKHGYSDVVDFLLGYQSVDKAIKDN